MRRHWCFATLLLGAPLAFVVGCSGPTWDAERFEVKTDDPMAEPESILRRYAEGQAMGSESEGFDAMVAKVGDKSPGKAALLEKGFAELKAAAPGARAAKAREILGKLSAAGQ